MKYIKLLQLVSLLVAVLGFCLSYLVTSQNWIDQPIIFALSNFLSYFTVQSNILAIASLIIMLTNSKSKLWRLIKFGTAVNITITLITYWLFLSYSVPYFGLAQVTNLLIHLIIPFLYIANWLLYSPKHIDYKDAFIWMIYPLSYYLIFCLIKGLATNWYPYYFVDLNQFTFIQTLPYVITVAAFFLCISLIFVKIGKLRT